MKFERKGSGLILWVGETPVKASSVSQQFGYGKLKKRLGEYDIDGLDVSVAELQPAPLRNTASVREYLAQKKTFFENQRQRQAEDKKQCQDEWTELKNRQAAARKQLYLSADSWKGRGALLNAMRKVQAEEQKSERDALKKAQKARRGRQLQQDAGRWPEYKTWLTDQGKEREAEVWRYRDSLPGVLSGDKDVPPDRTMATTHDLVAAAMGWRGRKSVGYLKRSRLVLVDSGRRIDVLQWRDRQNVLAALKLAHLKWGSCAVYGSRAYIDLCIQLAAEEGIALRNYEKEVRERQAVLVNRGRPGPVNRDTPPERLAQAFAVYSRAVGADRYRITAIRDGDDGSRQAWTPGKARGTLV